MTLEQVVNGIEGLSKAERIGLIFRWHNALVIEDVLSELTLGLRKFEFVPGDMTGNLVFQEGDAKMTISEDGLIDQDNSDFFMEELQDLTAERLPRMNKMVKKMTEHLGDE